MAYVLLPIGMESFTELRTRGCYYVDKTKFIEELLYEQFKVNLITRPRRFGKTLLMSMLSDFFDIQKDSEDIFKGLHISRNAVLCEEWRNQWPVLFLTLKNVEGLNFESAYGLLKSTIADICKQYSYLLDSDQMDTDDRESFLRLKGCRGSETETKDALYMIMRMMYRYYGKQVILFIDEYDVPLAKASENKYYIQMLDVVRGLIGKALKTNEFLKFAVITGCLRMAKESIFTGTNNFVSYSISDENFSDCFGFTPVEVKKLLEDTKLLDHAEAMKNWYDGYLFGKKEIYCPWDVLNYIWHLQKDPLAIPGNYWKNTSHNGIIRSFIGRTDLAIKDKFEILLSGGTIQEQICEDLTYDVLHSSESNLWSILYLTGYLTKDDSMKSDRICLKIPNDEIRTIFADTVASWFTDTIQTMDRQILFDAFWAGDSEKAAKLVTDLLFDTISYFDYKEDYYHAFLAGIFTGAGYAVESNHEYGLGRPDIVIRDRKNRRVLMIEIKHSKSDKQMESDCQTALEQIDTKAYARQFLKGYQTILCYGAAFFEKECLMKKI